MPDRSESLPTKTTAGLGQGLNVPFVFVPHGARSSVAVSADPHNVSIPATLTVQIPPGLTPQMEAALIAGLEQRFGAQPGSVTRISDSVFEPADAGQPTKVPPRKLADKAWTDMVPAGKPQSPRPLQPGESRSLTPGEIELAKSVFGNTITYDRVTIWRKRLVAGQFTDTTMTPDNNIYFHPQASHYRDDFSRADISLKAHFIHEMTNVLQSQNGYPMWTRAYDWNYRYKLIEGKPFNAYGIEEQAEIVKVYFYLKNGYLPADAIGRLPQYENFLPFKPLD